MRGGGGVGRGNLPTIGTILSFYQKIYQETISKRRAKFFELSPLEIVVVIGQNFIVDHQYCNTDISSTNSRPVGNIFILILANFQGLVLSSR